MYLDIFFNASICSSLNIIFGILFSDILEYNNINKNCKTAYFAEYHALFHIHFLFSYKSVAQCHLSVSMCDKTAGEQSNSDSELNLTFKAKTSHLSLIYKPCSCFNDNILDLYPICLIL